MDMDLGDLFPTNTSLLETTMGIRKRVPQSNAMLVTEARITAFQPDPTTGVLDVNSSFEALFNHCPNISHLDVAVPALTLKLPNVHGLKSITLREPTNGYGPIAFPTSDVVLQQILQVQNLRRLEIHGIRAGPK